MSQMNERLNELRGLIRDNTHADEATRVNALLAESTLNDAQREHVVSVGRELVAGCRDDSDKAGTLDVFMQEFSLSSRGRCGADVSGRIAAACTRCRNSG